MTPGDRVLQVRDVSHRYAEDPVLTGVDLELHAGQRLALMGPSGCGKSTLLLIAAGILVADSGSVLVAGCDLSTASREARAAHRRRNLGMVFQFGELISELTLLDNVALAGELAGQSRRAAVAAAHEVIERVGLAGLEKRKPSQVSGGQAQRAAIARAVVHRPLLIVADEPTGALDQKNARDVLDLLLEVARDSDAGLLLVTHDAAVAEACDDVLTMADGRIELRAGARGR